MRHKIFFLAIMAVWIAVPSLGQGGIPQKHVPFILKSKAPRLKSKAHNIHAKAPVSTTRESESVSGGDNRRLVRKGNTQYIDSAFSEAETCYRKAVARNPKDAVAHFNLGNALLRQRNPKDAAAEYENVIKRTKNPVFLAKANHNLGVIMQSQKQYGEAIKCYEDALRNNPRDDESRYNLALCRHLQKNQKQENKSNDQDRQEKDENKQQNKPQNNNEKQEQKKQEDNKMSKDNAERLLDAAKQEEQKTQDKLRKGQRYASPRSLEKNW